MTVENCTEYVTDDWEGRRTPCKCPVCSGFLKFDDLGEPVCNKCGAELLLVPDVDEETKETLEWGKICAVSGRKKMLQQSMEERRVNRLVREGTEKWKGWL